MSATAQDECRKRQHLAARVPGSSDQDQRQADEQDRARRHDSATAGHEHQENGSSGDESADTGIQPAEVAGNQQMHPDVEDDQPGDKIFLVRPSRTVAVPGPVVVSAEIGQNRSQSDQILLTSWRARACSSTTETTWRRELRAANSCAEARSAKCLM